MRKKKDRKKDRRGAGNPSKPDRECLSEGEERKMHLGREREEKSEQGIKRGDAC